MAGSGAAPDGGLAACTQHSTCLNGRRGRSGDREMKILICDQQLMLAEALAAALDARGYDVLAVTTTVSDSCNAADDCVPDVCLLGLHAGDQLNGLDAVRVILWRYPGTKVL